MNTRFHLHFSVSSLKSPATGRQEEMGSQESKKLKRPGGSVRTENKKGFRIVAVIAAIGVLAAAFVLFIGRKTEENAEEKKVSSADSAPATEARGDLNKLAGRWLRPDGGYIIEIRSIRANGKMDAGYFNPRPINVSSAEASHRGNELEVFIELQDVGYPGSTYTLTYDPQRDALSGTYFQAALEQSFEVIFVRAR